MPRDFFQGRHAGLLVPLFSIPSRESWGIGEIADLPKLGDWMEEAGFSFVQLLPINEMAAGQQSPYSAMSAMAIDPIFICVTGAPEYGALGGEDQLSVEDRRRLQDVRKASTVDYPIVRRLKQQALTAAFHRFREHDWARATARAQAFKEYVSREAWWLQDYALFR